MHERAHREFAAQLTAEPLVEAPWSALVPGEQWHVFRCGVEALERARVPFLLHGALALAAYTGRWRNTKDIDAIVQAGDHERAITALREGGFADYFEKCAYDRSWIFRGVKDDVIFDLIWDLPNHRVPIDQLWFDHAESIALRGRSFRVVPVEELLRAKLYVFQRERCDWVDVLNVLASAVERIDWARLMERMGRDVPLLHAALAIFNWLSPGRARALPAWVREQFALPFVDVEDVAATEARRVRLFDSRPWFSAHLPVDQPLER